MTQVNLPSRTETDSLGDVQIPAGSYYGAQTQRAVDNFPISGHRMPPPFIHAMGRIKSAAATVNEDLGKLDSKVAAWIREAAAEVADGKLDDHFPIDVFQTGSGTSSNMNTNEVISNRAIEIAGGEVGSKAPVHPNDHVNHGQSSNDVVPTAIRVSVACAIQYHLIPALETLAVGLESKAEQWTEICKIGRTHLMDATPLTLGQEFSGYAAQVRKGIERAYRAIDVARELPLGGTAVGTGINAHPEFAARVCDVLHADTGIDFYEAANHFEAQATNDACVEVSGLLRTIATSFAKIANDVRMLGSGPRCGIGEIKIPSLQPGSSIMPGKVNPVMSEMLAQVSMYVMGLDVTNTIAGRDGHFELLVTLPVMCHALHEQIRVLANGAAVFQERCIQDLEADAERCRELVEKSLMLVTALNPEIGYDAAASVAKQAYAENKTLREVVLERGLLDEARLDELLDPISMTQPKA
ncbi:MAG: fumarate hydratase class II [Gemmatimonadota bacterium]|nr:MAG: fumarate hydratase class II [Gemmatimonadota bacterium]